MARSRGLGDVYKRQRQASRLPRSPIILSLEGNQQTRKTKVKIEIILAIAIVVILAPLIIAAINGFKCHKLPPKPLVLSHICKHQGDDESLYCHVKITNPTAGALMTITHVQHPSDVNYEVALCAEMPRTLHGSQIIEFGFRLSHKPSDRETDYLLRGWTVTDSLGRKTMSRPNLTVPAFGAIAR
jgi:hypothetical protein